MNHKINFTNRFSALEENKDVSEVEQHTNTHLPKPKHNQNQKQNDHKHEVDSIEQSVLDELIKLC